MSNFRLKVEIETDRKVKECCTQRKCIKYKKQVGWYSKQQLMFFGAQHAYQCLDFEGNFYIIYMISMNFLKRNYLYSKIFFKQTTYERLLQVAIGEANNVPIINNVKQPIKIAQLKINSNKLCMELQVLLWVL